MTDRARPLGNDLFSAAVLFALLSVRDPLSTFAVAVGALVHHQGRSSNWSYDEGDSRQTRQEKRVKSMLPRHGLFPGL